MGRVDLGNNRWLRGRYYDYRLVNLVEIAPSRHAASSTTHLDDDGALFATQRMEQNSQRWVQLS
jgi:hypothetical protein